MEQVVAASVKRIGDTLFVFVMTTGTIHRLRVYRIDGIPGPPFRTFVPILEHEFDFAPTRLTLGDIPQGPLPSSGLMHILVAP